MLYHLYQAQEEWAARLRPLARHTMALLRPAEASHAASLPLHLMQDLSPTHDKPAFGLAQTQIGDRMVAVREEVVASATFGRLLRFAKDMPHPGPPLLVVAPQSGHYATRLRGTVAALLPDHDVHVTDWTDAREVAAAAGPFGLDDQVAQIIAWLEIIGPGAHLLSVSQPAVAALAATALMAEDDNPARPRSLTLIGGPVDPRIAPSREGRLARTLPAAWFATAETAVVPAPFIGVGRRVRPGTQQFAAAVLSDLHTHAVAQATQLRALAAGDAATAAAHRARYDELRSVMDVPGELYVDTVCRVFKAAELAQGRMAWRGRPVRPEAIHDTALLVIEGGKDASCSPGQGSAAFGLCSGLPEAARHHLLQPGATHDALFEGPAWEARICPLVAEVIRAAG